MYALLRHCCAAQPTCDGWLLLLAVLPWLPPGTVLVHGTQPADLQQPNSHRVTPMKVVDEEALQRSGEAHCAVRTPTTSHQGSTWKTGPAGVSVLTSHTSTAPLSVPTASR